MGQLRRRIFLFILVLLSLSALRFAAAQSTTDTHPCGAPEWTRFEAPPEVPRTGTTTRVDLTVKQDGTRLCFVWNGIPEAPVIRLRAGDHLVLHVTSEISDPCYINYYFGFGSCKSAAASESGMAMDIAAAEIRSGQTFYPIVPNMAMPATGITNVHTHGLEVSPKLHQDEVIHTEIVPPAMSAAGSGASEWTYDYAIPASHPPGLYWYHPHYHGETEAQAMMGLSGAIVIEDAGDDQRISAGISDQVIIVRDIAASRAPKPGAIATLLKAEGITQKVAITRRPVRKGTANKDAASGDPRIDEAHEVACNPNSPPSLFVSLTVNRHYVQEGPADDSALPAVAMFPGERRLIRLLNASADSYIVPNLVMKDSSGATSDVPFEVLGLDGAPLTDAGGARTPRRYDSSHPLTVPPGGRVEMLLSGPPVGSTVYLESAPFNTGCTGNLTPARTLLRFTPNGPKATQHPFDWASLPVYWLNPAYGRPADAQRTFALVEYPHSFTEPGSKSGATDFYITEIAGPDMNPAKIKIMPFNMKGPPNIVVRLNGAPHRVEEWTIQNYTVEAHAFHIHQLHFQEVKEGFASPALPLLDDIDVPIAQVNPDGTPGKPGEVHLKLVFTPAIAGTFPFHCHILYHEDNGMMGTIRIIP